MQVNYALNWKIFVLLFCDIFHQYQCLKNYRSNTNYGEDDQRQINLAHFAEDPKKAHLPTLKVLGWAGEDTNLHLDHVTEELKAKLRWPDAEDDLDGWRSRWSSGRC